ncbi:MAG: hypothetical protein QOE80_2446 [Actinomycetota bacterium]|jgi:hypothetical protein|nr:hypothetical protein [Actinomycetota bacterium]
MDDLYQHDNGLRALAMRVAALEDNVAFLEEWCEEQQDVLDRTAGPVAYDYEIEAEPEPAARAVLRVVDLRDEVLAALEAATDDAEALVDEDDEPLGPETILAVVETEHERRVRQIRARLERIRVRLRAEL